MRLKSENKYESKSCREITKSKSCPISNFLKKTLMKKVTMKSLHTKVNMEKATDMRENTKMTMVMDTEMI